jgi:hypothetical protein
MDNAAPILRTLLYEITVPRPPSYEPTLTILQSKEVYEHLLTTYLRNLYLLKHVFMISNGGKQSRPGSPVRESQISLNTALPSTSESNVKSGDANKAKSVEISELPNPNKAESAGKSPNSKKSTEVLTNSSKSPSRSTPSDTSKALPAKDEFDSNQAKLERSRVELTTKLNYIYKEIERRKQLMEKP